MKTETFKGEISSAFGNKLEKPVNFSGSFESYDLPEGKGKDKVLFDAPEGADKIADGDVPTVAELYAYVNGLNKNNARQKAMAAALAEAGIEKPNPNDPAVVMARMLKDIEKLDVPQDTKEMLTAVLRKKQEAGVTA